MIILNEDVLKESYDILYSEIKATISQPHMLFYDKNPTNLLGVLNARINSIKLSYDLSNDDLEVLRSLENELVSEIIYGFENEFPCYKEFVDTTFMDVSRKSIANFINTYFYLNRRNMLDEFLFNKILNSRSDIVVRYKTRSSKKDLSYNAMKEEYKLADNDYYILLVYFNDIVDDILGDENLSAKEIFMSFDMSEDDEDFASKLLENNDIECGTILAKSLMNSHAYARFKSDLRDRLDSYIRKLPKETPNDTNE